MQEDITGDAGTFRLRVDSRGVAMVYEITESDSVVRGIMASATGAIRFTEVLAATGSERLAWIASGSR